MIKFLRLSILIIPLIALFISCSDSPTSVGNSLMQNQDKIGFAQFDSYTQAINQNSKTYEPAPLKIGSSNKMVLGKNSYAQASVLLNFSLGLPDTTWTKFQNGTTNVVSSKLRIKTSYLLGDASAPFDFTVRQIRTPWNMYTVTKDSLAKLNPENTDISFNHSFTDTSITFSIKASVIKEWLTAKLDTNNTRNYGIIITPTSNTQKMRGFTNPFSSADSFAVLQFVMRRIPQTEENDTLGVVPTTGTFIVEEKAPPISNYLTLQAGDSHRNYLWFDLRTLPKNIIVSKATLELTNEPTKSFDGSPSSGSITVRMLADSTLKTFTSDSLYSSILTNTNGVYSGEVAWIIQKWSRAVVNQGLELSLSDEYSAVSRLAFYDSKASDKTKRPRLKIYYTQK